MNANGRINILYPPTTKKLFDMYDRIPVADPVRYQNALEGIWVDTELSKEFFSARNIQYLQENLRKGVYEKSKGQFSISIQDEDQLKIIMRSYYLQYSKNLNIDIKQQVHELNKKVLKYSIDQVYGEAMSYKKYVYDASTMYKPMTHPVLSKQSKTLEFKTWF